ncbi:hypothetical protein EDB87DRAFT_1612417 [Lactarius vividus]|nr:hypothetical protein EDB87DRAFT_1612417 [Lactarius vividus]
MLIAEKYILSDGIVVWRASVLWGPSRRFTVFIPQLFSLVCTLVLSAGGAAYLYIGTEYKSERDGAVSRYRVTSGELSGPLSWHKSLGHWINLYSNMAAQARKSLFSWSSRGAHYLCIWAVYIISTFTDFS